ncbi:histidine phosphatase family protein [Planomonospora parontospora]|uniref:histidine phosphatase family protein n=1 Tax=Planomonospora parontospora TaxID=58119 RepID=UPI001670221B|nr:histidine phosphatase family protein [Planomonospora parontospora]GGL49302.1 phosphoglycerate mutase [Planomonospora parontospora subsp. antibiotica]GII15209.1 phosphoglycerate mutase [Planomonospora parontospora subsp. antibiotica]
MAETTVIHLLRHGEVHNPANVLYGRLPGYHLSENGRLMAETAAKSLAGRDVVALFSSPMERAQETAAPLAETFGLEVELDDRLIEAANAFEGVSVGNGDGVFRNPRYYRHLWNPLRPSWGERYSEVVGRMREAVLAARRAARGHEAVLVSHQLPIWVIRLAAERRPLPHDPRRRQCGLASVTSFCFEGDRLASVGYAEPAAALVRRPTVPGA